MNQNWIAVRFVLLVAAIALAAATIGCGQPMAMLDMFLNPSSVDIDQEPADTDKNSSKLDAENSGVDEPKSKAEEDAENSGVDEPKSKAEDLVKDWDKPTFAIFFTGRQHGYMEPCGCTGLSNQKGGMMRRHSSLKVLADRGWDVITIDSGDQVERFGQQGLIKLGKTFESMCQIMKYDVIGLGIGDLKVPSIDLAQSMMNANQGVNPFVCANIEVVDPDLCQRFRIIEKNGKRIGITMVLGDEFLPELAGVDGITAMPAAAGLTQVIPLMDAQKCDIKILIAASSLENCREMAKKFPAFDLLITSGSPGDPTLEAESIDTGAKATSMVQVGVKGMYVGIVGFFEKSGKTEIKYERVPLDDRFEDSAEVKQVFIRYQDELKRLWESGQLADIQPRPHPSGHQFVGSDSCADCHEDEFQIWSDGNSGDGGPHQHATASLTNPNERSWVQRNFDPECVSCHMTGWNPQGFFPYESGFLDIKKDDALFNNGCENCHGPGSAHIDAERNKKDDEKLLSKLRDEIRVTVEQARTSTCVQCHDLDNSPDYVKEGGFDKYWPEIEH